MIVGRRRIAEVLIMGAVAIASFAAGARIGQPDRRPQETPPTAPPAASRSHDVPKGFPNPDAVRPEDPREPEQRAIEARAVVIRHDATAIEAECRRDAGGDWAKWQRDTAPYRADLKAKIDNLKDFPGTSGAWKEALHGLGKFPLFEVGAGEFIQYLYVPDRLDEFRRVRPAVAVRRWLSQLGIDLIFVAVPKMTEVYIDHFIKPCPSDGIIAPQVRRTLLELLKDDVEVVDGLPLFRSLRDTDSEYLYNTADSHWAPRGMRIMAKEVAGRIERYKFGARARYTLPLVRVTPAPYVFSDERGGAVGVHYWNVLSPEQLARAKKAQTSILADVRMQDGQTPPDDPTSPVLVIGHSYVPMFREQLVKELNLLVHTRAQDNQTTECFADFLREPELLAHTRVIVWITTDQHMMNFKPLPEPIMKALDAIVSPPGIPPAPEPSSPP
jgi:hypothetical protein